MSVKVITGIAFIVSPLLGQLNPNIPLQAGRGVAPIRMQMDHMEQAMRIRLLQEQQRMLAAQRELMSNQAMEENYRKGFEEGLKAGFENGAQATIKDFQSNYPMIEASAVRNMANAVFTLERPDDFRLLIGQTESALDQDPGDNLRKAMLVLYKYRLAELQPLPPTSKKKPHR